MFLHQASFIKKNARLKAFINFVFGSAPILVTLASFGTYVAMDDTNVLTADKVSKLLFLYPLNAIQTMGWLWLWPFY